MSALGKPLHNFLICTRKRGEQSKSHLPIQTVLIVYSSSRYFQDVPMSDLNAQFHLSLARVSVTQILRSTGVDRTRLSVLECLSELLVKYLMLLGQRSQEAAESAGRRQCDLVDLREACERMGAIATTSREGVREEEGVVEFISWCMSDEVGELRKFAGEGKDEMGEDVSADWLRRKYHSP